MNPPMLYRWWSCLNTSPEKLASIKLGETFILDTTGGSGYTTFIYELTINNLYIIHIDTLNIDDDSILRVSKILDGPLIN